MINFAEDIIVFLDVFGEPVMFTGPGSQFDCRGIFNVYEEPVIPLDGVKEKPIYSVSCAANDVTTVTPLYTVKIRNIEYRILATTFNPVMGMTEILLGKPS